MYLLKVTDKSSDCSWRWVFVKIPSPEDVQKTVSNFKYKDDPDFKNFKKVDFTKMILFGDSLCQIQFLGGQPPEHLVYIQLDQIDNGVTNE